jgi:hypothetical protein
MSVRPRGTLPRRRGGPAGPLHVLVDLRNTPRRLGGRQRRDGRQPQHRHTPASAGRTSTPRALLAPGSENPRVGGEDDGTRGDDGAFTGEPPRRQVGRLAPGHLPGGGSEHPGVGGEDSTSLGRPRSPEHPRVGGADAPACPCCCASCATEHPHVGGEDGQTSPSGPIATGTPPRRRGGSLPLGVLGGRERNTLASAGRTTRPTSETSPQAEHPRAGGEDRATTICSGRMTGTPPRRRRGAPPRGGPSPEAREKPRIGGEDPGSRANLDHLVGTPPRRRGGRRRGGQRRGPHRNTPASAGKTGRRGTESARTPEHPRVGGKDVQTYTVDDDPDGTYPRRLGGRGDAGPFAAAGRNTLASAGRATRNRAHPTTSAEHPRVGGEDWTDADTENFSDGTPPRRRGGRGLMFFERPVYRNTPASAGRTSTSFL